MSNSDSSRSSKAYHHGDLRQALLDATLELIDEHGPEGFTLRAAARKAGVTAGAAYHHFKDKEDLVAAVAEQGFKLFREELTAAAHKPSASDRERSRNVGVAYVLFATRHPTRFRVMLGFGLLTRSSKAGAAAQAVEAYQLVRDVLIAGLIEGSAEPVSSEEVLGWWSVVHGLAFLAIDGLLGRAKSAKAIEKVVLSVIDALDRRSRETR
jgi:AcrR family transcriptional regulator